MTLNQLVAHMPVNTEGVLDLAHIKDLERFRQAVIAVMNTSGVATGLGTHYSSREQEVQTRAMAGKALLAMDRGVFLLVHTLDGVTDHARQTAVKALLANNWECYGRSCFDRDTEMDGILHLVGSLPANRALNLFLELRQNRVNNSRTRKRLILSHLLNHPNLEWWSVKYRRKVRKALEHAWGKQAAGVIKAIIGGNVTKSEQKGLKTRIDNYLADRADRHKVYECIAFALGSAADFGSPLFRAFKAAKTDIVQGALLPPEVLEGIRSVYHKDVSQAAMLEMTRDTSMTEKQKALAQRKAKSANVTVAFNPMARTAVELYVLAYAEGMTGDIEQALAVKARQGAKALPVRFSKVGILLDDSFSMTGTGAQRLRPMAVALSMKDVLVHCADASVIRTASGRVLNQAHPLPGPVGRTDLSVALIDLLESAVDAVFILTDGYENAPSGRLDEVMQLLDRIGHATPVYQLNPAMAAETRPGLKSLSDRIPAIPVGNPQKLALPLVRAMIEVDVQQGIQAMAALALPRIAGRKSGRAVAEREKR